MGVCLFPHLLWWKMCPLARDDTPWQWRKHSSDTRMGSWAFLKYESTPVRTKLCSPYIKSGQELACHQEWSSLANGALPWVQCWSKLWVAVWMAVEEDYKFEPLHSFYSCHLRYFVFQLIWIEVGGWGKETGIQGKEHLVHLYSGCPLMGILWNMSIFTCSTHSQKSIYTLLSQTSLSRFFNFAISKTLTS